MDYLQLYKSMWKKFPEDVKLSGNSWKLVQLLMERPTLTSPGVALGRSIGSSLRWFKMVFRPSEELQRLWFGSEASEAFPQNMCKMSVRPRLRWTSDD